jgi:hypothetical protein
VTGQWLCEICFDALTAHCTTAWDGLEVAVCEDCLAPPVEHACWQTLGASSAVELLGDGRGEGYRVRFKHGAILHFRWSKPLRSRSTAGGTRAEE